MESGELRVLYLSNGKLFLASSDSTKPEEIESTFALEANKRERESYERQSWKQDGGGGGPFGGAVWGSNSPAPTGQPVRMMSVTGGGGSAVLYSLLSGPVGGLFQYDLLENQEKRLLHRTDFMATSLSRNSATNQIACSLLSAGDHTAGIAIQEPKQTRFVTVTEGDTMDQAPCWHPEQSQVLVYQSAGIGRDADGNFGGLGPYSLEQIDLESRTVTTILEDEASDFLSPKYDHSGTLYYIRRPYELLRDNNYGPIAILKDILLFPFRLLRTFFGFFNFMSMIFAGKPLTSRNKNTADGIDATRMMLWGRMIEVGNQRANGSKSEDGIVPENWQLMRHNSTSEDEVIASAVVSFDLADDDTVIYSDGATIFHRDAAGKTSTISCMGIIEQVCAFRVGEPAQ